MRHTNRAIPSRCRPRSGVVAAFVGVFLLALIASQWIGCTAERRYRVLSVLFDGVPDPNAPASSGDNDEFAATGTFKRTGSVHKPFAENNCDACHASSTGKFEDFDKVEKSACAKCHKDVTTQFTYMHGPVALGECRLCHSPHESSAPHLLIDTAPALCLTCHDREFLPVEPADHQTDRNCLECHVGHGSHQRLLLRDAVKPVLAAPATAPVTSQPTTSQANIVPGPADGGTK